MKALLGLSLLALLTACTPTLQMTEDLADYRAEISRLERHLIDNPGDAEALTDLGVIYMRTRNYAEGKRYLEQAYARDQEDGRTLFYLGLATELLGQHQTALRLYDQDVSRLSPYRSLMRGRAQRLRQQVMEKEMRARLAQEGDMELETSPRIVAVFPFEYRGGDERYAPLGRGLSEMVMVDLANISSLVVVERVRLQALLDELDLARSEYVDPATAPRSGRLLGAGRLVGGSVRVEAGEIGVDAALMSTADAATSTLQETSGGVEELFDLEKRLVLRLVDAMGVTLTPAEREAVERIPTRNLQAFLAYSRGLEAEDRGDVGLAAEAYQQAIALDPGFDIAAERAETAEGMAVTETVDGALSAAVTLEPPPEATVDLVDNRLRIMNSDISGSFLPGEDSRDAAQEGAAPIGEPPPPPGAQ